MNERSPSEIIQDFLDLIEESHTEYEDAKSKISFYDSRTYDWTHDLEDAANKSERGRLATAWQKELRQRRIEKDRFKMWEKVHEWGCDPMNKSCLKRLKQLLSKQKDTENYINTPYQDREYKRRVVKKDEVN